MLMQLMQMMQHKPRINNKMVRVNNRKVCYLGFLDQSLLNLLLLRCSSQKVNKLKRIIRMLRSNKNNKEMKNKKLLRKWNHRGVACSQDFSHRSRRCRIRRKKLIHLTRSKNKSRNRNSRNSRSKQAMNKT